VTDLSQYIYITLQINIAKFMIPIQKHQALNNPHQLFIANVKAKKP